ncbi:MAG: UDP binding domain-containing protein [Cyanobacteriota bacterium]|nr:UDP binding domain-containing protein [Cyanobacteriota bacterium]
MVLAGRRINDGMGEWVVLQLVVAMARRGLAIGGAQVLVLGLTFKENCPDLRNTKVVDVIEALRTYGMEPVVVDPWVDPKEAQHEYGLSVVPESPAGSRYAAVVAAEAHRQFATLEPQQWQQLLDVAGVLLDLKGVMPRDLQPMRL